MDQETTEPERLRGRRGGYVTGSVIVGSSSPSPARLSETASPGAAGTGTGVHPAMLRAPARAFALSVTLGNRRRSSIAADNSAIEDGADRVGIGFGDDEHTPEHTRNF